MSDVANETVLTFLRTVYERADEKEISLWNAFLQWSKERGVSALPNDTSPLEWTFVGTKETIIAHFPQFRRFSFDGCQTWTTEEAADPTVRWLTIHYVPLEEVKSATIATPVTLFVEGRLPVESRTLFNDQLVYSIVSESPIRLPETIRAKRYVSPEGTIEQLIRPIVHEPKPNKQEVSLVSVDFLDRFATRFDELKQSNGREEAYEAVIDDVWTDALNRYWLANHPPLIPWLIDTLETVQPMKERVLKRKKPHQISAMRKELERWMNQLQTLDPRFKH